MGAVVMEPSPWGIARAKGVEKKTRKNYRN